MPIDPTRLCKCHGEPMTVRRGGRANCVIKRREATRRYHRTDKGRHAVRRAVRRCNPRRVRLGDRILFYARTPQEARAVNAHIKGRLHEFVTRLKGGTQMESGTPG